MIHVICRKNAYRIKKETISMSSTNCVKFEGKIENNLSNGYHNFESKINEAFSDLKLKQLFRVIYDKTTTLASQILAACR